jgi:hypothetical protein
MKPARALRSELLALGLKRIERCLADRTIGHALQFHVDQEPGLNLRPGEQVASKLTPPGVANLVERQCLAGRPASAEQPSQ